MAAGAGTGRYAGREADERRAERRRRLLDAALELFTTQGYAATTIRDLYTRAGLAPQHLYDQVGGREELLRAVYDDQMAAVAAAVAEARASAPGGGGLEERLRHGLAAFAAAMTGDERRARLAYVELPGASVGLEEHRRSMVRAFAAALEDEVRELAAAGAVPDRDYGMTALVLVGATNELLLDWLVTAPGDRPPIGAVVDELVAVYAAVLTRNR